MIQPLQPPDLFRGVQAVHHGELDIHEHQVEAAGAPFGHGFSPVHGCVPAHLQAFHECFEKSEVDDVVFDD